MFFTVKSGRDLSLYFSINWYTILPTGAFSLLIFSSNLFISFLILFTTSALELFKSPHKYIKSKINILAVSLKLMFSCSLPCDSISQFNKIILKVFMALEPSIFLTISSIFYPERYVLYWLKILLTQYNNHI